MQLSSFSPVSGIFNHQSSTVRDYPPTNVYFKLLHGFYYLLFIDYKYWQYNIDKKHIMHTYFNYIIRNYSDEITYDFLNIVEMVVHNIDTNIEDILHYFCLHLLIGK